MGTRNASMSIWASKDRVVMFGNNDLQIVSKSNVSNSCVAHLGYIFVHPTYQKGSTQADCFLAGSKKFTTEEIEIYKVEHTKDTVF